MESPSRIPSVPHVTLSDGMPTGLHARFRLVPAPPDPGALRGAWWPRSPDLTAEAPALLAAAEHAWNSPAIHLTDDPNIWQLHPAAIDVDGRQVQAGCLAFDDPNQVTVTLASKSRLILAVVRPDTDSEQAEWILQRSVQGHNFLTAARSHDLGHLVGRDDVVDPMARRRRFNANPPHWAAAPANGE